MKGRKKISQYYRKERGQRREKEEGTKEEKRARMERAISNKIEKSGSPLPTIKDRRNTYTTHIYSPSNPRMANGSVKFPISFPDQREYPALPLSCLCHSFTHPRSHKHVPSSIQEGSHTMQACARMCPLDLPSPSDTNHESRIGQAAVKGTTRERGEGEEEETMAPRRKFHP